MLIDDVCRIACDFANQIQAHWRTTALKTLKNIIEYQKHPQFVLLVWIFPHWLHCLMHFIFILLIWWNPVLLLTLSVTFFASHTCITYSLVLCACRGCLSPVYVYLIICPLFFFPPETFLWGLTWPHSFLLIHSL